MEMYPEKTIFELVFDSYYKTIAIQNIYIFNEKLTRSYLMDPLIKLPLRSCFFIFFRNFNTI